VIAGSILRWNAWGLFGVVSAALCWAMALFVLKTRPDRTQNRRLASMLAVEGVITLFSPSGAAFAASDATARVFFAIHMSALFVIVPLILRFVATIETPLAAPLRTRAGVILPWIYAVGAAVIFVLRPGWFNRGFLTPWWGGRMFDVAPLGSVAYAASGLAALYSLALAVSAFRRAAPGSIARERARQYAIAFGVRDTVVLFATSVLPGIYGATHGGDIHPLDFAYVWAIQLTESVFVLLIAYGVLRAQLFDIDLRIAKGLRRSTVAAIVLFAFFAAAELAERLVSEEFGYVIGAFAAAALIFAHKPIERFAASLSSAILPGVEPSEEYVAFRKLEVYREALEAALEDEQFSDHDRAILRRLQTTLGVAPADAARLEEDVRQLLARRKGPAVPVSSGSPAT
jgi:hypothetical protein